MPAPAARTVPDKQALIIRAALRVFAEHGVHGTAVPPIAREAGVAVGSLYRYFDGKEALVNAVFRDTKALLAERLLGGLDTTASTRQLFGTLWDRLVAFAREEPAAFRFLELQDHSRYLDADSRRSEKGLLAPLNQLVVAGQRAGDFDPSLRPDVAIALFWGAVVGLFKAERTGYLRLGKKDLENAREACWRALANPEGASS